jgi:putative holliday junction resolvase
VRVLALDFGERRIGVALSDELGLAAHPLATIPRVSKSKDIRKIKQIVREHGAESLVVGLPVSMNGTLGRQAGLVLEWVDILKGRLSPVPVVTWDERLTSVAAERVLIEGDVSRIKRKQKIDQVAAVLILQGYLDSLKQDITHGPG